MQLLSSGQSIFSGFFCRFCRSYWHFLVLGFKRIWQRQVAIAISPVSVAGVHCAAYKNEKKKKKNQQNNSCGFLLSNF